MNDHLLVDDSYTITPNIDIIYGGAWGDEGKGKVVSSLYNYEVYVRYNGGPNAGHTIYVDGQKKAVHQLPSGAVFKNKACYIGPGCVLNLEKLYEEAQRLDFDLRRLTVHPNTTIIETDHILDDIANLHKSQGSTGNGIAPAYAAKHGRVARTFGQLKQSDEEFPVYTKLVLEKVSCEGFNYGKLKETKILIEAAQGINLDINLGNYPYVTSSSCSPFAACSTLGFSPRKLRHVICVAKAYDTRSGVDDDFYPYRGAVLEAHLHENKEIFDSIAELGHEYGTTTGRARQISFLNLKKFISGISKVFPTIIVINKLDILDELGIYKYWDNFIWDWESRIGFVTAIRKEIYSVYRSHGLPLPEIIFSATPHPDNQIKEALND